MNSQRAVDKRLHRGTLKRWERVRGGETSMGWRGLAWAGMVHVLVRDGGGLVGVYQAGSMVLGW
jgi:hypothetical protein